jgi:hypothetical protein
MQNATTNNDAARDAGQIQPFFLIISSKGEIDTTQQPPRLVPSHVEEFSTLDMSTLKIGKTQKRKVPEQIRVGSNRFDVNAIDDAKPWKNGRVALRMTNADSAAYSALLARHKAEREQQQLERRTFLVLAAKYARRVCKADCTTK